MSDIQIAIDAIKGKLPSCQMFIDYYDGRHRLAFASSKFETTFGQTVKGMRDNLCPIVVDAPTDRMEVLNFAGDETNKAVADAAWAIWQRETLELVSHEVHKEALKCGIGYLIVWADEDNLAKFYEQDSRQCVVIENEDTGKALFGAKQWTTLDKYIRLTLYYADRIEKYISNKKYDGQSYTDLKESSFVALNLQGEEAVTPNPYGTIPMFKFEAWPILGDAIPIQDALNKTIADSLVTMEFQAFPQRWAVGLDPPKNELTGQAEAPFKAGSDRLWVTDVSAAKFGEFTAANLEQFLKVADSYRLEMARVSKTPLHFFSITSDAISGEALKTMESQFTKKVKRLTLNFGTVWANAMKFALQIEGQSSADNLSMQWQSPEQRSEKELWETLGLKADLGVPEEVCWEEAGYTEEDIAKFKELAAAEPQPPPMVNQMGQKVDANGVPLNAQNATNAPPS